MKKHLESHMNHGFTQAQWDYIFAKYVDKTAFFIDTFELPDGLGAVTNELYGPSVGDPPVPEVDVFYAKRGDRTWNSRLTRQPKRPTRFVRVIAGPHADPCGGCEGKGTLPVETLHYEWKDETCPECKGTGKGFAYDCILYTAYGVHALDTPASPKETGDLWEQMLACNPNGYVITGMEERYQKLLLDFDVADIFWLQHALAADGQEPTSDQ